jgi:hypothetical protein
MNPDELKSVLNNPAVSAEQKQAVLEQLGHRANKATNLEGELLRSTRKPDLASIEDYSIGEFCRSRNWTPEARSLFNKWLFASPVGREGVERMANSLRRSDIEEYGAALVEWKDSGFKRSERLIRALESIVQSPDRGNYHDAEAVERARAFLNELRRRAGTVYT